MVSGFAILGSIYVSIQDHRITWMIWGYPHDIGNPISILCVDVTCGFVRILKLAIEMTFKGSGIVSGCPKLQKWSISLAAFDYQRVAVGKLTCQITPDIVNN